MQLKDILIAGKLTGGGGGGPEPSGTKSISVTQNGTTTHNIKDYASAQITANVPNSYAASDEGKVVDNGALVAQTSQSITANGTYDTTLKDSVSVDVPVPPGYIIPTGTKSITENGTGIDVTEYAAVDVAVSGGGGISIDDIATNTAPNGAITLSSSVTSIGQYAFANKPITNVIAPGVTSFAQYAFYNSDFKVVTDANFPSLPNNYQLLMRNPKMTNIKLTGQIKLNSGSYALRDNTGLITAEFPNATTHGTAMYTFGSCSNLELVDIGNVGTLNQRTFDSCAKLTTIIMRSTSVVALSGANAFNGTPFRSGGSGGTIYIPKALYDHLGDGSALDYKVATNWSTVEGYDTITWAKIEGSIYEI